MLKQSKIQILFLFFISLNIIKIVIAGDYQDTSFSFDRYAGITDTRQKMDSSSVYLDLSNAGPKGVVVRVYIIDSYSDRIRSNGGDFFRCELGKKYFLYNTVREMEDLIAEFISRVTLNQFLECGRQTLLNRVVL